MNECWKPSKFQQMRLAAAARARAILRAHSTITGDYIIISNCQVEGGLELLNCSNVSITNSFFRGYGIDESSS